MINTFRLANGIATTVYIPPNQQNNPVIILCHGFCGIQDILLPGFAQAFSDAGFTAITFDYSGFGASDGERGRLIPAMQIQDIVSVIDWAKTLPECDAERIGLWGTSLGACHIFGAAVERPQVKCIVSQMGFSDGEQIVTGSMVQNEKEGFIATLEKMAEKRQMTGKEMFVPLTKVLADEESKQFFEDNKVKYPALNIKIPFLTIRETLMYKPYKNASKTLCPTLVVVAEKDRVNPPSQGIALYEAVASEHKKLCVLDDARHYEVYFGDHFNKAVKYQVDWFGRFL